MRCRRRAQGWRSTGIYRQLNRNVFLHTFAGEIRRLTKYDPWPRSVNPSIIHPLASRHAGAVGACRHVLRERGTVVYRGPHALREEVHARSSTSRNTVCGALTAVAALPRPGATGAPDASWVFAWAVEHLPPSGVLARVVDKTVFASGAVIGFLTASSDEHPKLWGDGRARAHVVGARTGRTPHLCRSL